jgi:hypothetical protein
MADGVAAGVGARQAPASDIKEGRCREFEELSLHRARQRGLAGLGGRLEKI